MAKINLSKIQLIKHLDDNIEFLRLSSNSFDNGFLAEAKRLAVTIRVLLHDTGMSHSLLEQLGIKNSMDFYNTANPFNPENIAAFNGLVIVAMNKNGISFKAPLDETSDMPNRPNDFIRFSDWWDQIVIKDNNNVQYTRCDLVRLLANKDGGAHVDPKIDENYMELKESNRMVWRYVKEENGIETFSDIKDVEFHSIRQIAYEVLKSIDRIKNTL